MDTGAMKSLLVCCLILCFSTRLVEGTIYGEVVLSEGSYGAVQIYLGESVGWASVCYDDYWDDLEAKVVCHQLGYENGSALLYIYPNWEYIPNLHLIHTECDEYDFSLIDCRFNTSYSTCSTDPAYAGVQCVSAGWSSSFYIGLIVMIFVLAACFSFFVRIFCGSKERAGIGQWSWYRARHQSRNSGSRRVFPSGGSARCEEEESLCHEPEDPKLTQPAPPSYSDAIELSQIPPPSYSAEFEGGHQDNPSASQHELASNSSDLDNCSPPAYASVVATDSLPPSSSSVTHV